MVPLELTGEVPARLESFRWVGLRERDREPSIDRVALVDGEVAGDVAALVEGAALQQRPLPEHLDHGGT